MEKTRSASSIRPRLWMPWIVLGVALFATVLATGYTHRISRANDIERFNNAIEQTRDTIKDRLETYKTVLRGVAGLFASNRLITQPMFQSYVDSLNIRERYKGLHGVGFTRRVRADQVESVIENARKQGVTRRDKDKILPFDIWPIIPTEPDQHTILYLQPLDYSNHHAIGFNMSSEAKRSEAMVRARDSGEPAASAWVRLMQEIDEQHVQRGFLLYFPIYTGGGTPPPEKRAELLRGFAYAPFRASDLFSDILGSQRNPRVNFAIYDAEAPATEQLLYTSEAGRGGVPENGYRHTEQMNFAGRVWTVVFWPRHVRAINSVAVTVPAVGGTGILISLLLFWIARVQSWARWAAEETAESLRRSERALRWSEGRLRRLVESNLVGVVFCDVHGHFQDANEAYLQIIGYSREDLLSGKVKWDRITPPEWRSADEKAIEQLRVTGVCAPYEKEFIRGDGTRVPVLIGVAMLEGEGDQCVAVNVDLRERKRAEAERQALLEREQQARREAEAANRLKDEFLANVSHELRTPLNAILGWAQLLQMTRPDTDTLRQGLGTIERNARAQAQLVEDLLDVSRIITGKLHLQVKTVELRSVVEAAVGTVRLAADAKDVRLDLELDPDGATVQGDANRLQQVVWNLLSNAIKFTPGGGFVTVRLRKIDHQAELTVRDTGEGIGPSFLPHVFAAFRQADASTTRKHGGLGLGLAIVRQLVELHGGTIEAYSEGKNTGATFTVRLPLSSDGQCMATEASAEAHNILVERGLARLDGVRVLVVDDQPDVRELVHRVLVEAGAKVKRAESAADAMEQLETDRFDVLVCDIAMPEEDGYSLISRVRSMSSPDVAAIPAIAVTALARPEDRERLLAAGFQLHVPKPVDADQLTRTIADMVSRSAARTN